MTNATINTEATTTEIADLVTGVVVGIAAIDLEDKLSMKMLAEKINELVSKINSMSPATRVRGPLSENSMTEEHARRIMLGDLKDASHKEAGETLKLSYGQIYSARKGFTFKAIYQEMIKGQKAEASAAQ
jgi:hypothetical protein